MEKSYQGILPEVIYAHEYGAATYKINFGCKTMAWRSDT